MEGNTEAQALSPLLPLFVIAVGPGQVCACPLGKINVYGFQVIAHFHKCYL